MKSTVICGGGESEVGRGVGRHSEHTAGALATEAEGSYLYLVIPVVSAKTGIDVLIQLLHNYKVVVVLGMYQGGGSVSFGFFCGIERWKPSF